MTHYLHQSHHQKNQIDIQLFDKDLEALAESLNSSLVLHRDQKIDIETRERNLKASIASISHDLRTPLTAILGYVRLVRNTIHTTPESDYLETTYYKATYLHHLLNEFFELSLYESDEHTLDLEKIDFTLLVTENLMENYQKLQDKGLVFDVQLPNEPLYLQGDRVACNRIVQNLLSNILRYAKDRGAICLSSTSEYIELSISNTTVNLDEKAVSQLFDRFFKGDSSRSQEGSGLGLYIVKTLVEKMSGTICATLDSDHTLIITLYFPRI